MNTANSSTIQTDASPENKSEIVWAETPEQRSYQVGGMLTLVDHARRPTPRMPLSHITQQHRVDDHRSGA